MMQFRIAAVRVLKVLLFLTANLVLMNPGQARADILLTIVNAGTPSGSNFLYTYDIMLTPGSELHLAGGGVNTGVAGAPSQNYFTLYDIPGFVTGSVALGGGLAANASFTTQN